jgi:hypothetical protein
MTAAVQTTVSPLFIISLKGGWKSTPDGKRRMTPDTRENSYHNFLPAKRNLLQRRYFVKKKVIEKPPFDAGFIIQINFCLLSYIIVISAPIIAFFSLQEWGKTGQVTKSI